MLAAANQVAERSEDLGRLADGQLGGLLAAAPRAGQQAIEGHAVLAEGFAGAAGVGSAFVAQIALGGAVLDLEARRVAVAAGARRIRMAHEHHMPRLA
jgi:hypothetical protein